MGIIKVSFIICETCTKKNVVAKYCQRITTQFNIKKYVISLHLLQFIEYAQSITGASNNTQLAVI